MPVRQVEVVPSAPIFVALGAEYYEIAKLVCILSTIERPERLDVEHRGGGLLGVPDVQEPIDAPRV